MDNRETDTYLYSYFINNMFKILLVFLFYIFLPIIYNEESFNKLNESGPGVKSLK